jgi:yggt family protein
LISIILSVIAGALSLYTLLCFIYILLSWFPGARFTKFGKVISSLCEPYMNFFSKLGFLRIGNIDFSPIISLGLLSVLSSIVAGIQGTGRIYFGGIIATIIYMLWNILTSILSIFILLIFIRWIVLLIHKGYTSYESGWNQVDMMISKIAYKVASTFTKKTVSYQTALLITWISFVVIIVAGRFVINVLVNLCYKIPF